MALIAAGLVAAVVGVIVGFPAVECLGIISSSSPSVLVLYRLPSVPQLAERDERPDGYPGVPSPGCSASASLLQQRLLLLFLCSSRAHGAGHKPHSELRRIGRSFKAIREDELAARAMGVSMLLQWPSRWMPCVLASEGVYPLPVVCRTRRLLDESVKILVMVILGGLGSIAGSIVVQPLSILSQAFAQLADYSLYLSGAILIKE